MLILLILGQEVYCGKGELKQADGGKDNAGEQEAVRLTGAGSC